MDAVFAPVPRWVGGRPSPLAVMLADPGNPIGARVPGRGARSRSIALGAGLDVIILSPPQAILGIRRNTRPGRGLPTAPKPAEEPPR